ncbi:MAG: glucosidase [Phycisphaerales bacterium]|nr:glucosidase [Phycisphaerales bacterium]
MNSECQRLAAAKDPKSAWKRWGPYLSERQWGTVREDYSEDGNAWDFFPHDHARSRAYKWGEDGIAGYCDDQQRLCLALALWNGKDPIIKERLFGLTNGEGNHGEDVKEVYFYEDSTPTHSWMRYVYMYPQDAYPYDHIVATNRARRRDEPEYELLDTGIFDRNRYFEVQVDFAKSGPDDTFVRIRVINRGPEAASLHVRPHLWFRNDWWLKPEAPRPNVRECPAGRNAKHAIIAAEHHELGKFYLYCDGAPELLFTENETNTQRLWNQPNAQPYVKDAFNSLVVHGARDAVNPAKTGTKSAAHYAVDVPAGSTATIRLRLSAVAPPGLATPFAEFEATFEARKREADEFYAGVIPASLSPERANVMRQALSGMLWTKQYYFFDLDRWLDEHNANPISGGKKPSRNREWFHMLNRHVISMPDKWEYPWYAAWDLAFHALALQLVDPDFARDQLALTLSENYLHPNGQIPAYEWNFGDVNPPVHAWAVVFLHLLNKFRGKADPAFLKAVFPKLSQNFNWWINRKDPEGRNLFSGGFLGLDNIGVFDRSAPLPTGGHLLQVDGTAWMAFFSHCMLQMALELVQDEPSYETAIARFLERFLWIAGGMHTAGDAPDSLWDEEDGFFYDVLVPAEGTPHRLKIRSMVGLLPLMACTVFEEGTVRDMPAVVERIAEFSSRHPELMGNIHPLNKPGVAGRRLLSIVNEDKLRRILSRMLDENQFLSPFGVRSLSREHAANPFIYRAGDQEFRIDYQPAESLTGSFGGNSNWRGPVWFPVNALLLRGLLNLHRYYGDAFRIECPTGSGTKMNLYQVACELARRLESTFLPDASGRRPVNGDSPRFREDPAWRDRVLFYEYFHGDTGQGLGASHQTGWTGLVAFITDFFERIKSDDLLEKIGTKEPVCAETKPAGSRPVRAGV